MGNGNAKGSMVRQVVLAKKKFRELIGMWDKDRADREHWKEILDKASSTVSDKRTKLLSAAENDLAQRFKDLLEGKILDSDEHELSKEICVFLSSTFSDMGTERDLLMEDVYPYLRTFCRALGYSFVVCDMRWGVRDEMTDRHLAVDICTTEIQRCRTYSAGPFMVCVMGDKYGYRPIPERIDKELFHVLQNNAKTRAKHKTACELLDKWYKLDENSKPNQFVLQPISTFYPNAYRPSHDAKVEQINCERSSWARELQLIADSLRDAASEVDVTAFGDGKMTEMDFHISITEREVKTALTDFVANADVKKNARRMFLFIRSLKTVDGSVENANTEFRNFEDRSSSGDVDQKAQDMLQALRRTCTELIPAENTHRYSLQMRLNSEGDIDATKNKKELADFCDHFCQFMVDAIQQAVAENEIFDDPLYDEVFHQSLFYRDRATAFTGRKQQLQKMEEYLEKENGSKPFVVYGMSGSGKTSLMAKACMTSLEKWKDSDVGRPVHVIRFLGTSPASSNVRGLLSSLCQQICLVLGDTSTVISNDLDRLVSTFHNLLTRATADKPFILFLDSLDQLSDQDDGRALRWLPGSLPRNVHLLVSTLPTVGGCLVALRTKLKADSNPGYFMEVPLLEAGEAESILDMRLDQSGRCLTADQRRLVLETRPRPTALYMKLVCDTALTWPSYATDADTQLKPTSSEMIIELFGGLVLEHGEAFVRRALGYITASRTGLTRGELEDILSCDDIVLDDHVFKYHVPPVRRLPPVLWTRLRNDLGSYLVEVSADGHVVYKWYHRIFWETARSFFLSDKPFASSLYVEMANYFLGRWANEAKPYTEQQTGKVYYAHRMVAKQPLIFNRESASTDGQQYNLRKLSELPHHLIKAEMWSQFIENMCSFPWLEAKCRTGRVYELASELFEAALRCNTERASVLGDFHSFIRANAQILSRFPGLVLQQALNEPDESCCSTMAQEYRSTPRATYGDVAPCWRDLTKSQEQTAEVVCFKHPSPVTKCVFSKGCKYLATYSANGYLRVYSVGTGAVVMTTACKAHVIAFPANADQCHWVLVAQSQCIARYSLGSGCGSEASILGQTEVDCDVDDNSVMIANKKGKYWEVSLATSFRKVRVFSFPSHGNGKLVFKDELPRRPKALAFTSDGKSLGFCSDKVYLWGIQSTKDLKTLETGKKVPTQMDGATVGFSSNGSKFAAILGNGTFVWNVPSRKLLKSLAVNCLASKFIVLSPDLDYIASPHDRNPHDLAVCRVSPKQNSGLSTSGWQILTGHSEELKACVIGSRENHLPLIATSSDDNTVQIWDTKHMFTPTAPKLPRHSHPVRGCAFSPDGNVAVSCSSGGHLVWQTSPLVKRLCQLRPVAEKGADEMAPCFSDDSQFVALFRDSGVDVWHLHSGLDPRFGDALVGMHFTLTFLSVSHLFTRFTADGLSCCLATEADPSTLRLYLPVNRDSLMNWAKQQKNDQPPSFLLEKEPFERQFHLGDGKRVTAASVNSAGTVLAAVTVPSRRTSLDALSGPAEVTLWDLGSSVTLTRTITSGPSVHHSVSVTGASTAVFVHEIRQNQQMQQQKRVRSALPGAHASMDSEESSVHVISNDGNRLQQVQLAGRYSGMFPLKAGNGLKEWIVYRCLGDELQLHRVGGKAKSPAGTVPVANTEISGFALAPDCMSLILGCSNGEVCVLKAV